MSDKLPQPTAVLIHRLRRVAKWLDSLVVAGDTTEPEIRARANTCLQAAGRLEDLGKTETVDAGSQAPEGVRDGHAR